MKLQAEEDFAKGKVSCSLATADNAITIGFADTALLRPKTLLKSNELNPSKAVEISLVIRRKRGTEKFDTIIQGAMNGFCMRFSDVPICDSLAPQTTVSEGQNSDSE